MVAILLSLLNIATAEDSSPDACTFSGQADQQGRLSLSAEPEAEAQQSAAGQMRLTRPAAAQGPAIVQCLVRLGAAAQRPGTGAMLPTVPDKWIQIDISHEQSKITICNDHECENEKELYDFNGDWATALFPDPPFEALPVHEPRPLFRTPPQPLLPRRLSLVRRGVESHPFYIGSLDAPVMSLSLAAGFAGTLLHTQRNGTAPASVPMTIAATALMTTATLLPAQLETAGVDGGPLRHLGRAVVVAEPIGFAVGAGMVFQDNADLALAMGGTAAAWSWTTTLLRSRGRRDLALEPALAAYLIPLGVTVMAGAHQCGAFDTQTTTRCSGATVGGLVLSSALGLLMPSLHISKKGAGR